ncbi:MAG: methyltransferase domain-containing protein [Bryobacterales bacterium]
MYGAPHALRDRRGAGGGGVFALRSHRPATLFDPLRYGALFGDAAPTGRDRGRAAAVSTRAARKLPGGESRRVQLVANVEALPFADGGFTAATATDLLEHVAEPQQVLAELGRVLDDGARRC